MKKSKDKATDRQRLGKKGEEAARSFLLKKGYALLESNWRYSKSEIDLIAKDGDILVFVEVKTLSNPFPKQPEDVVSERQFAFLARAANVYMEKINHDWEVRFDLIIVSMDVTQIHDIQHYEDIYFPSVD